MEQQEPEEIIELTKPKRSGRKKVVKEVPIEPTLPEPTPQQTQTQTQAVEQIAVKPKRTPKKKIVQEDIPVAPVAQPEPLVRTSIEDDPDYELFLQYAMAGQQALETPKPMVRRSKKQIVEQPIVPNIQEQELVNRIDTLEKRISTTKSKKTSDENAFLRQKLADLEAQLEEMTAPTMSATKPKVSKKTKTLKVPRDRLEIIAQGAPELPKQLPLRALINSFGF